MKSRDDLKKNRRSLRSLRYALSRSMGKQSRTREGAVEAS